MFQQALSYQSTKKKKLVQSRSKEDDEKSEVASTVASSVACHEDIEEISVSDNAY